MRYPLNLGPNHLPFASCAEHLKLCIFVAHGSLLCSNGLGNKWTSLFLRVRSHPEAEPVFLAADQDSRLCCRQWSCETWRYREHKHLPSGTRDFIISQQGIRRDEAFPKPWSLWAPAHSIIYYWVIEGLRILCTQWKAPVDNRRCLLECLYTKSDDINIVTCCFPWTTVFKHFFKILIHEWLNRSETLPQSVN